MNRHCLFLVLFLITINISILADINDDLLNAAIKGQAEEVKRLIDAGAEVNAGPALALAAGLGNTETVQVLIAAGTEVNEYSDLMGGYTSLMFAAMNGHTDIVQALLVSGVEINAVNDDGKTALMLAKQAGHMDIVSALADAVATNKKWL